MDRPARQPLTCAERDPRAPGVVSRRVEGDLHRQSRAELTARARQAAGALAAAGLARGDRVATLAWNGHRHLELAIAAGRAGVRLHALDARDHPDGIVRTADDTGARIIFFDLSFMPLVEEIAPRLATAQTFVALTDRANMPVSPNLLCYEEIIAQAPEGAGWPGFDHPAGPTLPSAPDAPALLPQDVVLAAIPMFHADGRELVSAAWADGAGLVLPGPWLDGRSLHELIESEGVTVAAAGRLVWRGLLAHAEREGASLSGLRLAIVTDETAEAQATASALRDRHGVKILRGQGVPLHEGGDAGARAR
jgi:fatty-acyl-CoA synthase